MLESMKDLGREEGLEEGMEKGREEGREEGKEEVATNLLKLKVLSIDQISIATGFAYDYIRNLAHKLNIQTDSTPAFA